MNVVSKVKTFNKTFIENVISTQGNRINKELQNISLSMNKKKSQFMLAMSSQRRKASRVSEEEKQRRGEKLKANIGNRIVDET